MQPIEERPSVRPSVRPAAYARLRRIARALVGLLVAVAIVGFAFRWLLGIDHVGADAEPFDVGPETLTHFDFGAVLSAAVREDGVDYAALVIAEPRLRRYAATVAVTGPTVTPELVASRQDLLAWYINSYNALTLLGVLAHWPIESVHDVRGPVEPIAGMGFFWSQTFDADGRALSLHALEGELRELGDARIHAAINCASRSCPSLSRDVYTASNVDEMLDAASRRFVREHVVVDETRDVVVLSSIFKWYEDEFVAQAKTEGWGLGLLDWVRHFADATVAARLSAAQSAGYATEFEEYDWSLNRASVDTSRRQGGEDRGSR